MDQYIKKKLVKNWFKTLQEVLCKEIEELEGKKSNLKLQIGIEVKIKMKVVVNTGF